MKVYIGGYGSCGVRNEGDFLKRIIDLNCNDYVELTEDASEADLIVFIDSCIMTYQRYLETIYILNEIISNKKEDTKVILSGCLANGVKFEHLDLAKDLLSKTKIVSLDKIISYILKEIIHFELDDEDKLFLKLPFRWGEYYFYISPVSGCLNHCSFCKQQYMNFDLNSVSIEYIKNLLAWLEKENLKVNLYLLSSNLSLYGVDLYGRQRIHEVIRLCSESSSVLSIRCNALINFYPELVDEIINNKKVNDIFASLETGSHKLYNTMNRPICLEHLIEIIKKIRKERPDILIETEIISGFPGETIEDFDNTLSLIKELGIYVYKVHEYEDSSLIVSSKLSRQYKPECKKRIKRCYDEALIQHNDSLLNEISGFN